MKIMRGLSKHERVALVAGLAPAALAPFVACMLMGNPSAPPGDTEERTVWRTGQPVATQPVVPLVPSSAVPVTPPVVTTDDAREPSPREAVYFRSCAEAKRAGAAPLRRGQPGYRSGLDRDGDGIACET